MHPVFASRGVPAAFQTDLKVVFHPFQPKGKKRLKALQARDLPYVLVLSGFLRGAPETDEERKKLGEVAPGMIGFDPLSRIGWGMRFIRCQEDEHVQFIPDDHPNKALRGCAIWRGTLMVADNNRHPRETSNLKGIARAFVTPQYEMDAEEDPANDCSKRSYERWEKLEKRLTEERNESETKMHAARAEHKPNAKALAKTRRELATLKAFHQRLSKQGKNKAGLKALQEKLEAKKVAYTSVAKRASKTRQVLKQRRDRFSVAEEQQKEVRARKRIYGDMETQVVTHKDQKELDKQALKENSKIKSRKKPEAEKRVRKLERRKIQRHGIKGGGYDYDPMACKHKVFLTVGMEAKVAWQFVWIWWLSKLSLSPFARVLGEITVGWEWRTHTRDQDAFDIDDRKHERNWSDVRRMMHRHIYHNEGEFASHIIGLKQKGGDATSFFTKWLAKYKHAKHDVLSQKFGRKVMYVNNYLGNDKDEYKGLIKDFGKWMRVSMIEKRAGIKHRPEKQIKRLGLDKEGVEKRIKYRKEEARKWDDRLERWVRTALKEAYPDVDIEDSKDLQDERQAELDALIAAIRSAGKAAGASSKQIEDEIAHVREDFPLERGSMMAVLSAQSGSKLIECPACDESGMMQDWEHYDDPSKRIKCQLCAGSRKVTEYDQTLYYWCEPRNPLRYLVVTSDFYKAHYREFTTSQAKMGQKKHDPAKGALQRGPNLGRYGYFIQGLWNHSCQLGPGVSQVTFNTVRWTMEDNYGNLNDVHPPSLCQSWPICAGELRLFGGADLEIEPIWNIILDKFKDNAAVKGLMKLAQWAELCLKGTLETSVGANVDVITFLLNYDWRLDCSAAVTCLGFTPSLTLFSARLLWGDMWLGPRFGLSPKKRQERMQLMAGDTIIFNTAHRFTHTCWNETQRKT